MDEIEVFLLNWFEAVADALYPDEDDRKQEGKADAKKLISQIEESDILKNFVKNPLLLQITALVHKDRGILSERRVELYHECTNALLEKWDMAKGLDVKISGRESRKLLQPIAFWLHSEDKRKSAPLGQIIKVIEKPLADIGKAKAEPEELLLNIRDRSGLFMGYNETEYGFSHLSFQEYLAAEEIRNRSLVDLLVVNYENKRWKEVAHLSLGLDNPSILRPL